VRGQRYANVIITNLEHQPERLTYSRSAFIGHFFDFQSHVTWVIVADIAV
jgi:hypothetical protein